MEHFLIIKSSELRKLIHEELVDFFQHIQITPIKKEVEYLGIVEASKYLNVSPHTLRRKARNSEVPCYKRGNKWLFSKSELKEYIAEGKVLSLTNKATW
ncbi:helix-turn-helix domain-containing protein [uncultured Polaribacter sp.]|uniref:helix-turn-helix domain-containing protein n=1 Tax=uncultured Polaribacter sp. TaxID=174711 RepID=UPI0026140F1D|nr:helix-turn-helix domain-containing protein [uncultured Polaribacter sp.]